MITTENLHFSYKNVPLFHGLNLSFPSGSFTMMTGSSGSGKSTLLYLLALLLKPTDGKIYIQGTEATSLADREKSRMRAQYCGFVFQDASLDPGRTILDNVLEPALYAGHKRNDAQKKAHALLEEMGVTLRENHRPGQISGGQAQRVAIARACINDPHIIFADEPTGNLDPENSRLILDKLLERAHTYHATVIMVTHDHSLLPYADHVMHLDQLRACAHNLRNEENGDKENTDENTVHNENT